MKERRYIFLVPIVVIVNSILWFLLNIAEKVVIDKEIAENRVIGEIVHGKWNWNLKYLTVLSFIALVILGLNIKFYWNLYKKQDTELLKDLKRFKIINWIGVSIFLVLQIIFAVKGGYDVREVASFFMPLSLFGAPSLATGLLYLVFPTYILLQKDKNDFIKIISILVIVLMIVGIFLLQYCLIILIFFLYLNLIIDKINLK